VGEGHRPEAVGEPQPEEQDGPPAEHEEGGDRDAPLVARRNSGSLGAVARDLVTRVYDAGAGAPTPRWCGFRHPVHRPHIATDQRSWRLIETARRAGRTAGPL